MPQHDGMLDPAAACSASVWPARSYRSTSAGPAFDELHEPTASLTLVIAPRAGQQIAPEAGRATLGVGDLLTLDERTSGRRAPQAGRPFRLLPADSL